MKKDQSKKSLLSNSWPHFVSVLLILAAVLVLFAPQFQDKALFSADFLNSQFRQMELEEFGLEHDGDRLWNNSLFSGMPDYYAGLARGNFLSFFQDAFSLGIEKPAGIFIGMMLMTYLAFVLYGYSPWLSLIMSLAMGLCAGNIHLVDAGHYAKLRTIATVPLVICGFLLLFEKRDFLKGGLVFLVGMTMNIYFNHPQMTYYLFIFFLLYFVVKAMPVYKEDDWQSFGKALLIMGVCTVLGLAASASKIMPMAEYSKHSIRGQKLVDPPAELLPPGMEGGHADGLSWQKAMNSSNGFGDILAIFIPGVVGGSSIEPLDRLRNIDVPDQATLNVYWGVQPFTHGPHYFGAVLIFLFVFSALYLRSTLKVWIVGSMLLAILLALGSNLAWFNRLFYNYFPLYAKFRAHASILYIVMLLTPWLILPAIEEFMDSRNRKKKSKKKKAVKSSSDPALKPIKIAFILCGSLALLVALLGPMLSTYSAAMDEGRSASVLAKYYEIRQYVQRVDAIRTFFFVLAAAIFLFLYRKSKVSKTVLIAGIGILTLLDVISLASRYFSHDEFVDADEFEAYFEMSADDQRILNSRENRYDSRVINFFDGAFNNSNASKFHNNIGGYHAAKLRRYDDIINSFLRREHRPTINMLNGEYIIGEENGAPRLRRNEQALGNAWFIKEIMPVQTNDEEFLAIESFDPATQAIVHQTEFNEYLQSNRFSFDPQASINLNIYEPDRIGYQTSASSDQIAVFSEVWYGPNLGWQAYIDGEPVDHIRANYILRAMHIPAGNHEVVFEFQPKTYHMGLTISKVSSLLILLLLGAGLGYKFYAKSMPKQGKGELA